MLVCLLHMSMATHRSAPATAPPCTSDAKFPLGIRTLLTAVSAAIIAALATPAHAGASRLEATDATFIARLGDGSDLLVRAERALFSPAGQRARLFEVAARVEDGGETSGMSFACRELEVNLRSHDLVARGDVRGVTDDGLRYFTELVRYDRAADRLSGTSAIRVESGNGVFRGDDFEYFLGDERLSLRGRVRLEQRP